MSHNRNSFFGSFGEAQVFVVLGWRLSLFLSTSIPFQIVTACACLSTPISWSSFASSCLSFASVLFCRIRFTPNSFLLPCFFAFSEQSLVSVTHCSLSLFYVHSYPCCWLVPLVASVLVYLFTFQPFWAPKCPTSVHMRSSFSSIHVYTSWCHLLVV